MATAVKDLLQLAWQSDLEGRPGTRDALLTLAVAECGVEDVVLAERCRRVLVARRPDHWLALPVPLSQSLDSPRVVENLTKLKAMFPEVRVRHMLMRGASKRGPFLGAGPSSRKLLHDLTPSPTPPRPHFRTRPADPSTSTKREPTAAPDRRLTQADVNLVTTYATVLLAIAVLLDVVIDGDRTSEIRTAGG